MNNIIKEFNITLEEFIIKLSNQFSTETKIKVYLNTFRVTKMYNSQLPLKIYMGGCLNFKDQIKNRDSDFFINRKQFVERVNNCTSFADDIGLVDHWLNLSDESKTSIWDYIQTLFVMGEMYISNNTNLMNNINNLYNNLSKDDINNINNNEELSDNLKTKLN